MNRRIITVCVLAALLVTLTGCWDNQEPKRRAYVLGMAIDPAEGDAEGLKVTVQIPLPVRSGERQAQRGTRDYYLVDGTGPNLMEALSVIQTRVSRELFYGQMRSVVISDRLTAGQIEQLVNMMERNPDIEETIYMLLAVGPADRVMEVQTPQERLPALYFNQALESIQRRTRFRPVQIWEFWKMANTSGWEPALPVIHRTGEQPAFTLSGIGVYHHYDLRGVLNAQETAGYLWLAGETRSALATVPYKGGSAAMRSMQVRRQLSARLENGRPVFDIVLMVTGEVAHAAGGAVSDQVAVDLERLTGQWIKDQTDKTLKALQQQYRSDILGLGKLIYYRYPDYFRRVNWDSVFPTVRINVQVRVEIARVGMLH